jgi:CelD/BcsL family acetyltransferase involved in cellulose biosynthesis
VLTLETLLTIEDLSAIAPEWDSLALLNPRDGLCRSASWCIAWHRHLRPDAKPFVVTARKHGRLVGVAPLCTMRKHGILRTLTFAGEDIACGDYLGLLTEPDCAAEVEHAVFSELKTRAKLWDLMHLPAVLESEVSRCSEIYVRDFGPEMRLSNRRICPFISLPATYEEYLQTLSGKRRKSIRLQRKYLMSENGVEVRVASSGRELQADLDVLIELHQARWNSAGLPGTLTRRGFREFLSALSTQVNDHGCLRLFTAWHGGTPIAAQLNFHFKNSAMQFQAGWDPQSDLASLGPGALLISCAIEHAIVEGKTYYDFMRGAEEYKFHYTQTHRTIVNFSGARSLTARSYLTALDVKERARNSYRAMRAQAQRPATA